MDSPEEGLDGIVQMCIRDRLKDHLTAIIGDATGLSQKFVSLATVLAHHHLTGISAVDLRVPAAPVLIPKKSRPIVAGNVTG